MAKLFALAALAIVLLTAGAMFLVNRLTDDSEPRRSAASRAGAGAGSSAPPAAPYDPPAQAQPPADFSSEQPGQAIVIPARPPPTGAIPNESPPIQGPTAVPLPEDREERGELLMKIRRDRAGFQMDRINQRNRERVGLRLEEDPPPPPPPMPDPAPPQP